MKHLHPSVAGDIDSIMITAATRRPLNFLYLCAYTLAHLHSHTYFRPASTAEQSLQKEGGGGEAGPCLLLMGTV